MYRGRPALTQYVPLLAMLESTTFSKEMVKILLLSRVNAGIRAPIRMFLSQTSHASIMQCTQLIFSSFIRTACELGLRMSNFVDSPTQPISMLTLGDVT